MEIQHGLLMSPSVKSQDLDKSRSERKVVLSLIVIVNIKKFTETDCICKINIGYGNPKSILSV